MRKIFDDRRAERESEDYIGSGEIAGVPYLMLINAQGEGGTLATLAETLIPSNLEGLIPDLLLLKNSLDFRPRIEKACETIVDDFEYFFTYPKYKKKKPFNFSLVLMLPGADQTKKIICFGLGDVMVLLERKDGFVTLKPAILSDGKSRCMPIITNNEQEILQVKEELKNSVMIVKLEASDQIHLLSPNCYRFLSCKTQMAAENKQFISLVEEPNRSLSDLIKKAEEAFYKKRAERLIEGTRNRDLQINRIEEECARLTECLKSIDVSLGGNNAWRKSLLLKQLAVKLAKNHLDAELIVSHNCIKITNEEQAEYARSCKEKHEINLKLVELKKQIKEIESSAQKTEAEPEFSHARMYVPENDFGIFELRVSPFLDRLFYDNYRIWVVSRCQDNNRLPLPFRNFDSLFMGLFKDSLLGRALLLLAISEAEKTFAEFVFTTRKKPTVEVLTRGLAIFDAPRKEAFKEMLLFLKDVCQNEKFDESEVLKRVEELETFLIEGKPLEEEENSSSSSLSLCNK